MILPGFELQRVGHLLADLSVGGAQLVWLHTLRCWFKEHPESSSGHKLFSLRSGPLLQDFQLLGIECIVSPFATWPLPWRLPLDFVWLCWWARRNRLQVIHALPWLPGFLARCLSRLIKLKVICQVHGFAYYGRWHYFLDRLTWRWSAWWFVAKHLHAKFMDQIVRPSLWPDCSLEYWIIYNQIDKSRFIFSPLERQNFRQQQHIASDVLVLGAIGRFDKIKNFTFLITLFSRVLKLAPNAPDLCLVLVGCGPQEGLLKKQAIELGVSARVKFLTMRPEKIPVFYSAIDCLVVTSTSEGQPLVIMEALANGLPVLVPHQLWHSCLQEFAWPLQKFTTQEELMDVIRRLCIRPGFQE